MKNSQKGFLVPLLIIIIAVLAIGGGFYIYNKNQLSVKSSGIQTASTTSDTSSTSSSTPVPGNSSSSSVKINVAGMRQYIDADFGFSFWYPNDWHVIETKSLPFGDNIREGNIVKEFSIGQSETEIVLQEVHSPTLSIIDTGGAGPFGPVKYFFNPSIHSWMSAYPQGGDNGESSATTTIKTFTNTMGGLHMFPGTSRFDTTIIPLSAANFVVLSDGGGFSASKLAVTIVASDPSVATPVSKTEQIKTIQSEAGAYNIAK
jgi:hypothetical protein